MIVKKMEREGVTQVELARRTGIAQSHLSEYLSGKREPRLATINKMAEALGLRERFEWKPERAFKSISKS